MSRTFTVRPRQGLIEVTPHIALKGRVDGITANVAKLMLKGGRDDQTVSQALAIIQSVFANPTVTPGTTTYIAVSGKKDSALLTEVTTKATNPKIESLPQKPGISVSIRRDGGVSWFHNNAGFAHPLFKALIEIFSPVEAALNALADPSSPITPGMAELLENVPFRSATLMMTSPSP